MNDNYHLTARVCGAIPAGILGGIIAYKGSGEKYGALQGFNLGACSGQFLAAYLSNFLSEGKKAEIIAGIAAGTIAGCVAGRIGVSIGKTGPFRL